MLHEKFDASDGPLWRVQLITEATMDRAGLGEFGGVTGLGTPRESNNNP